MKQSLSLYRRLLRYTRPYWIGFVGALLGLVVIACMVLGVAAADGDPFDMLAAGAMGLIVTVLMMALWAALDVWRQRVR